MDVDHNRLFILSYFGADTIIEMFDATTFLRTGSFQIPQFLFPFRLEKAAGEQLAMTNGNELVILPISLFKP